MGKGSKGGKKQEEAPKVEETKKKPDAAEAEAGFMKALQREMGDVEKRRSAFQPAQNAVLAILSLLLLSGVVVLID